MYNVTYYKLGNRWYLDLPDYVEEGGNTDNLERIGFFHEFLQMAAQGEETVIFQMDTRPFEGANVFELVVSTGSDTGGYYRLQVYEGLPVHFELWFNTVIYKGQPVLPQRIYFKKFL